MNKSAFYRNPPLPGANEHWGHPLSGWRLRLYTIIFEADTRAGRQFDLAVIIAILLSVGVVLVSATLMYIVEGPEHGFTSIPMGMYWAITTMTTVGFGDITPKTELGRTIASVMMLLGWGVLAVPTGIVTAEMTAQRNGMPAAVTTRTCHECLTEGHAPDANYCRQCGAQLSPY